MKDDLAEYIINKPSLHKHLVNRSTEWVHRVFLCLRYWEIPRLLLRRKQVVDDGTRIGDDGMKEGHAEDGHRPVMQKQSRCSVQN